MRARYGKRSIVPAVALLGLALTGPANPAQEENTGYEYRDAESVRRELERVLARPEFSRLRAQPQQGEGSDEPAWIERFVDWLGSIFGPTEAGDETRATFRAFGIDVVVYVVAALFLVAALVWLARSTLSSTRERKVQEEPAARPAFGPASAPGELDPSEYLRRAREYAEGRDHKRAIRELLLAAMSAMERSGGIRFRKGLTNRDYLRAARGDRRRSLAVLVRTFELVYFGRREATAESYSECFAELQKSFPWEAA